MNPSVATIFQHYARPLLPESTGVDPRIVTLPSVKAVLFDVYGTLFISASGDLGTSVEKLQRRAWQDALDSVDLQEFASYPDGVEQFRNTIRRHHALLREEGVDYPEVDILRVWQDTLAELARKLHSLDVAPDVTSDVPTLRRLATEFETRANPIWPMPGLSECLAMLRGRGYQLGIVSNAQFFTSELFQAFLDADLEELGFDRRLLFFSYAYLRAKPGTFLYERAREVLSDQGVRADEILFVGNDMRNDIWPARTVGFRTALFAGDRRSLRLRTDDPCCDQLRADVTITELGQLTQVLPGAQTRNSSE
jgi:putative hydrolase of the HAD superfamily